MKVYLVGAHSCGKTTLCRYVSKSYGLSMLPEVARTILAEMEVPLERLRTDIDLVNEYQRQIMLRQIKMEKDNVDNFVSDRAFDGLAYTAEHGLAFSYLFNLDSVKEYINWVKTDSLVFFLRPNKILLKEDGVRESPTWESVLKIDGMIKLLLECYGVDYLPISCVSMQERVRTIDFVMKLSKRGNVNGS